MINDVDKKLVTYTVVPHHHHPTWTSRTQKRSSLSAPNAWVPPTTRIFPTLKNPKLRSRSSPTFSFLKLKPSSHGVPIQKAHPLPLNTRSLHPFGPLSLLLLPLRQLPHRLRVHRGLHRRQSPIRSRLGQARLVSVLLYPLHHTQK